MHQHITFPRVQKLRKRSELEQVVSTKVARKTRKHGIEPPQQEAALIPNFWGQLWILNRLDRVSHMYLFLHSILSKVIFYVLPLIDKSIFLLLLLMLF